MVLLLTASKAQKLLSQYVRERRLQLKLTQAGLANRSGVSLSTLRKFEQMGVISLESFLKLLMVLDCLDSIVEALKPVPKTFASIDEVLEENANKTPKRGSRT